MKKTSLILTILLIAVFALFALGSGESETTDQGSGKAEVAATVEGKIGKYSVVIDSCRLAKDYEGKELYPFQRPCSSLFQSGACECPSPVR